MAHLDKVGVEKLEAQVMMMQEQRLPSSLMNFYNADGQLADGKLIAECKTCLAKCRYSPNVTSNLVTHLRNRHPEKHVEYEANRSKKVGQRRRARKSINGESMITFTVIKESQTPEEIKQLKITKKLVSSIACDCLTINIVQSPSFRDLMREIDPNYKMPSTETMKNCLLPEYAARMEVALRRELKTFNRLYLTVDMWTKSKSNNTAFSFLGVTVHFINGDWELKSRALGCDIFEGEVKVSAIINAYESVVDRFDLRGKVRKLFVDNATSIEKALNTCLPGFQIENSKPRVSRIDTPFGDGISFPDAGNMLPDGISFTHAQLLCVRDGLSHPEIQSSSMTFTLLKVSSLVHSLSSSDIGYEFLRERGIELKSTQEVKWMAQIGMLSSIVDKSNEFNVAVNLLNANSRDNQLNTSEILVLKELLVVLEPFVEALESGNSGARMSISAIGPIVCGLKQSLQSILNAGLQHCSKLASILLDAVTARLDPFLSCDDVKFASFLDPRFKLEWIQLSLDRDQLLTNLRSTLRMEFGSLQNSLTSKIDDSTSIIDDTTTSPKRPRLFSCLFSNTRRGEEENDFAAKCINEYLKQCVVPFHVDPLQYWKNAPASLIPLSKIARDILPCSTSLSNSHRIFNIAKNYCSPQNENLDTETLRLLIFIKCNQEIMQHL